LHVARCRSSRTAWSVVYASASRRVPACTSVQALRATASPQACVDHPHDATATTAQNTPLDRTGSRTKSAAG
jgi:hypothetical protein